VLLILTDKPVLVSTVKQLLSRLQIQPLTFLCHSFLLASVAAGIKAIFNTALALLYFSLSGVFARTKACSSLRK
jgi:hypothetical protein